MYKRWHTHMVTVILVIFSIAIVPKEQAIAQVSLEIEPSAALENAQTLSLTGLGIDTKGSGPVLISVYMENLTGDVIDNLYLEVIINAAKIGNIVELTQRATRPFSLKPFQSVYATNNDLAREAIPGIDEKISFSGGLTPEGDDLINGLSGTTLPRDVYSVEIILFRITDAEGRVELARDFAEVGGASATGFEESEIFLKTPGDVAGSSAEITNPYPQFSWEGANNVNYRLLVVENNGQDSPESLLQSAKSSSPMSEGGSLLQFENLDVIVNGNSFQFPSSGVQPLERGKSYFWRVITIIQTTGDTEEVSSEIWNFTLLNTSQATSAPPISNELQQALIELLGEDRYQRLQESGFTLEEIEYDGQSFTGQSAVIKLEELLQRIRDEEILLGEN